MKLSSRGHLGIKPSQWTDNAHLVDYIFNWSYFSRLYLIDHFISNNLENPQKDLFNHIWSDYILTDYN